MINLYSTHLLLPMYPSTSSFINLRLPLTDVSGGGVVFAPGPGCHLGPVTSNFLLNAYWVLIYFGEPILG